VLRKEQYGYEHVHVHYYENILIIKWH